MSKGEKKSKAKKKATKKKAEKVEEPVEMEDETPNSPDADEPVEQVEPVDEPVVEETVILTPIILLCSKCGYDMRICIIKETQKVGAICVKCGAIHEVTSVDITDEGMANIEMKERSEKDQKKLPKPFYVRCLVSSLPVLQRLESSQ